MNPTPQSAFTIIELLVVISIIAILIGFSLPIFRSKIDIAHQQEAVNTAKLLALAFDQYNQQHQRWPGSDGPVKGALLSALTGSNSEGVVYFEIGTKTADTFFDPWGNYYRVKFDNDFNNKVTDPDGGTEISTSVIVWSVYTNFFRQIITNKSWK